MEPHPMRPRFFRFLDLPREIRLIVYEHLPRSIHEHSIFYADTVSFQGLPLPINPTLSSSPSVPSASPHIVLPTRSISLAILATCKFVNDEATNIVKKTIHEFMLERDSPPEIIIHGATKDAECIRARVLKPLLEYIQQWKVAVRNSSTDEDATDTGFDKLRFVGEFQFNRLLESRGVERKVMNYIRHVAYYQLHTSNFTKPGLAITIPSIPAATKHLLLRRDSYLPEMDERVRAFFSYFRVIWPILRQYYHDRSMTLINGLWYGNVEKLNTCGPTRLKRIQTYEFGIGSGEIWTLAVPAVEVET